MDTDILTPQKKVTEKKTQYEAELADWLPLEKAAIDLVHVCGMLWYDKSVELVLFRNQLVDRTSSEILNIHQYAKDFVKEPINVIDTLMLANEIKKLDLAPSRIDLGRLGAEWLAEKGKHKSATDFMNSKLGTFIGKEKRVLTP